MGAVEEDPQGHRPNRARRELIEEVAAGRRRPSYTNKQMQESYKQHIQNKTVDREQKGDIQQVGRSVRHPRQDATIRKAMAKNDGNPTAIPIITLTPPSCASSTGHATESITIFEKANSKRSFHKRQRLSFSEIVKAYGLPESSRLRQILSTQELSKLDVPTPSAPTRVANSETKIVEGHRRHKRQSQFSLGALDQVENVEKAAQTTGDTQRSYEWTVRLGLLCSNEAESTRVASKFAANEAAAMAYL